MPNHPDPLVTSHTNNLYLTLTKPWYFDEQLTRPDWVTYNPRSATPLWLDKNENSDPELADVTNAVLATLDSSAIFSYPESGLVYRKIALMDGVSPYQLRLTHGSDGAIRTCFDLFVKPGDVVVHTSPTFAMYSVYCRIFGAKGVDVKYEVGPTGPVLSVERLVDTIRTNRPKLVCLPNPDSPTGTVLNPDQLKEVLRIASNSESMVLVDEAYYPFYSLTAKEYLKDFGNLIIARTFAKAWGLAGLRVGYLITSEPLALLAHKIRPMYEVNTLAVMFLEKMLDKRQEMLASVRRLTEGKDYFCDQMHRLGLRVLPTQGNFMHVHFGALAAKVQERLSGKVLYRPASTEACLLGYSRFSSTTRSRIEPIVREIEEVCRDER